MGKLDLVKILKDCPEGTKLYCTIFGEVLLDAVSTSYVDYPIFVNTKNNGIAEFTKEGLYFSDEHGECVLFPSKECRDWSQFKQSEKSEFKKGDHILYKTQSGCNHNGIFKEYEGNGGAVIELISRDKITDWKVNAEILANLTKVEEFNRNWLKTGDEVLVRDRMDNSWQYAFFSHISQEDEDIPFNACGVGWKYCIPYNYETKHLVGTTDAAPEFYQ